MAITTLNDLRSALSQGNHLTTISQLSEAVAVLLPLVESLKKENDAQKGRLDKLEKKGPQPSGGFT